MFPVFNLSNLFSPPPGAKVNQPMLPFWSPFMGFPPIFLPVNSPDSGVGSLNSTPSSSGSSPQNVLCTPSTSAQQPVQNKRRRITSCNVCKHNIAKDNSRSQGPRRHILQFHLKLPLYKCPHCKYSSNYDKAHVNNHMERTHKDKDGKVICLDRSSYAADEEMWFEKCFAPNDIPVAQNDANLDAQVQAPLKSFSVDSILSPVSRPKSNSRFAPYKTN